MLGLAEAAEVGGAGEGCAKVWKRKEKVTGGGNEVPSMLDAMSLLHPRVNASSHLGWGRV